MIDQDIKKLDELARKMESAELPLEESLLLFNDGIQLIRKCTKTLEEAELKVKEILATPGGGFEEKPL
jgi:exodeoxyribonuclease VII small subunit